ncbi:MAG: glycosyltransferase [Sphingobacteriales bacterium]|nr:MAG: glycosyltransferase [Sphingobacteriales bacterium]
MTRALIIFLKYPQLGECKTRLAKTIGDVNALKIYQLLLNHTHQITKNLYVQKYLYFDKSNIDTLNWEGDYKIEYQNQADLGGKMQQAFAEVFDKQHYPVIIIGTDCMEITSQIINDAYRQLNHYDVVIGPAKDGGYYLLGLNNPSPQLFENMEWSTNTVLSDTIKKAQELGLSYCFMPVLNDIDVEEDLTDNLRLAIE